jgi:NADH-quinone oxidoreductase subunit J
MLPRGTARGRGFGIVMASVALGFGAAQMPALGNWLDESVFIILAGVTVVSAAGAVTFRDPVYCALWFGLSLLGTAGLFLFNGAQFLAVATLIVYAGAILVTFLFVLMLAQPEGKASYDRRSWEPMVAAATGAAIVGVLSMTVCQTFATNHLTTFPSPSPNVLAAGILAPRHVASLGNDLFGPYLAAVEVAGLLLFAALVGAAAIVGQHRR